MGFLYSSVELCSVQRVHARGCTREAFFFAFRVGLQEDDLFLGF